MIHIEPFGKNILVRPKEKKTYASVKNASFTDVGVVIAVGDEVKKIKVNDEVGFVNHGLLSLDYEGTKLYMLPETDDFLMCRFIEKADEIL